MTDYNKSTQFNVASKTGSGPVLRKGVKGTPVSDLQQILGEAGFSVTVDGVFGTETETAVIRFQGSKGLSSDGVVGPSTWNALANAVGRTISVKGSIVSAYSGEKIATDGTDTTYNRSTDLWVFAGIFVAMVGWTMLSKGGKK